MFSQDSIFTFALTLGAFFAAALPSHGRLGETEAQSQQRYGAPAPELSAPTDKTLLEGAKEVIYNYQGWRIRAAFAGGTTMRIEYARLPENNLPKKIGEEEVKAILEGEKGTFTWREDKPRTGNKDLNALKALFDGRRWERSDHAVATLKYDLLLVLETRNADAYEKKVAKQPKTLTPVNPNLPKF